VLEHTKRQRHAGPPLIPPPLFTIHLYQDPVPKLRQSGAQRRLQASSPPAGNDNGTRIQAVSGSKWMALQLTSHTTSEFICGAGSSDQFGFALTLYCVRNCTKPKWKMVRLPQEVPGTSSNLGYIPCLVNAYNLLTMVRNIGTMTGHPLLTLDSTTCLI
jgi:hypothetical protein